MRVAWDLHSRTSSICWPLLASTTKTCMGWGQFELDTSPCRYIPAITLLFTCLMREFRVWLLECSWSMGWLKGKSTGNHRFSYEIWDFPVIFPLNQSIELCKGISLENMALYGLELNLKHPQTLVILLYSVKQRDFNRPFPFINTLHQRRCS